MTAIFLVKCPNCGKKQKTITYKYKLNWTGNPILNKKSKKCVYCGKTFRYKKRMIKRER